MTVLELKAKLEKYPDDYKVIIDVSRDYEEYDEVARVIPCEADIGICGMEVRRSKKANSSTNAILLN